MKGTTTAEQLVAINRLVVDKKKPHEQTQKVIDSGFLSDLFDADLDGIDRNALRKLCGLGPIDKGVVALPEEPSIDTIIRVDRTVRPVYPDWVKDVLHPELETVGPAEYDLVKDVELYLHEEQKSNKSMKGPRLYEHLKETDTLKICLGLHDALEIQKKGIATFRKVFGNKVVYCWKSVVRNSHGDHFVPYVCGVDGSVVVDGSRLDSDLNSDHPVARFVG